MPLVATAGVEDALSPEGEPACMICLSREATSVGGDLEFLSV